MKTAVVIGVGPLEGLGATLCRAAAREALHVVVAGRTPDKLAAVVAAIEKEGGAATAVACDTTREEEVVALFEAAEAIGPVALALYNAGNNMPSAFLDTSVEHFETCYRVGLLGGFLFAREALRSMVPHGSGCLLFTGASASMRGKPGFAAFTAAKGGLRNLAQSLAREFQPQGIHVGHVVIDGGIYGEKIERNYPEFFEKLGEDGLIGLDGIADAFMFLYRQPRNAWTFELDLRTHVENF
ncbi:MAG: SDR family NAD(P)-dependent oxidoreductase [Halieaceae bacterium]|jgi:NAD(P)-dependent dehydrogenase (short-subunit alcohol dehydrogenase family)|nr:SDR family NAD(P)-dependent oxidoreductase [Halieaceae bacterium]